METTSSGDVKRHEQKGRCFNGRRISKDGAKGQVEGEIENILRNAILITNVELSMYGGQKQPPRIK